jgi:hypothetical protein
MKLLSVLLIFSLCLSACSGDKDAAGKIPVIDVVNEVGNYQRMYCSDLFSSMKLIPLETRKECLINVRYTVAVNDSLIVIQNLPGDGGGGMFMIVPSNNSDIIAFDRSGFYLNPIGKVGQGPEEYVISQNPFFNTDKSTLFVEDFKKVIEYDYKGNFINSFSKSEIDGMELLDYTYAGDGHFIAKMRNNGKNPYSYCLLDEKGFFIKGFPNHIFYKKVQEYASSFEHSLYPVKFDEKLYLKDVINDTIYLYNNLELKPAFVFEYGEYSFPIEIMENANGIQNMNTDNVFHISRWFGDFLGFTNNFFYRVRIPKSFAGPKSKPVYSSILGAYHSDDTSVYGIYNISKQTNILLDTEPFYLQKGIINDLNGGLSFIPKYYAGNGEVIDIWSPADMKEMLTDEYFASLKIKDPQAHQKLKELLKALKDDDNPVVVVAKLK